MAEIANWRDASQYPAVEGTPMTRWHWEFLRRNPGYQSDYHRFEALSGAAVRAQLARRYGLEGVMLDYRDPHRSLFQSARRDSTVRMVHWQTTWLGEDETGRRIEGHGGDLGYLDPRVRQHECAVVFDLRQALAAQLASARGRLERLQEIRARRQGDVERFPLYLRLVDAWDAEITEQEMRDVLLAGMEPQAALKQIRIDLEAALRLRDVDYLYL